MSDYGNTPPPPPPGDGGSTPPPPPSGGGYDGGAYGAPPPAGGYGGVPAGPPPSNNLVLAIISLLCCWPIGIPAVVFAAQVNGKWNGGDQAGAIESAAKAKKFAIIALALGIVATIIYIILIAAGVVGANATSTGM
ncbi:MAG: CD225/dispanin family protein [Knoellia sp.]